MYAISRKMSFHTDIESKGDNLFSISKFLSVFFYILPSWHNSIACEFRKSASWIMAIIIPGQCFLLTSPFAQNARKVPFWCPSFLGRQANRTDPSIIIQMTLVQVCKRVGVFPPTKAISLHVAVFALLGGLNSIWEPCSNGHELSR